MTGHETRRRKEEWYDEECREASRKVRKPREKYPQNTDDQESRESLISCRSRAKRLFKRKKNEHLVRELDKIERDREEGKIREQHKRPNAVKKGFQARKWMVKKDDVEIVYGKEEGLNQWLHYFKELVNKQDPANPIPPSQQREGVREGEIENEVEEPSLPETKQSIKELKNNNAPGCDETPAELLKIGGERLEEEIHWLILRIWREEEIPRRWRKGIITPIHEEESKQECHNYRGIRLLCVLYKVSTNYSKNV